MNGRFPLLELLARLPARVWVQAVLGLIGFVILGVLGFAVIAGLAAVILVLILGVKARAWVRALFTGRPAPDRNAPKVTDVPYEIVERRDDERR